ncbi:MAG: hypothetical protein V4508_22640, partial [Pseudomonadota bacterium]
MNRRLDSLFPRRRCWSGKLNFYEHSAIAYVAVTLAMVECGFAFSTLICIDQSRCFQIPVF